MDNTEETGEQNIVNIDSSSTGTDTSNGFPEVTPAPRQSLPKVRKAQMQEQEIAALQAQLRAKEHAEQDIATLQAQLQAREHELALTQRQVFDIMTQSSSPGLSFPEHAPYISFTMEEKVQQLQAEKARRDKELNEAIQYLEVKRLTEATPRRSLETPGPHRLHEKVQLQEDTLLQQRI